MKALAIVVACWLLGTGLMICLAYGIWIVGEWRKRRR